MPSAPELASKDGATDLAECSWRAPGRVNLIGEHTDYNDGFCLPLAIPQGCTATVSPLAEPVIEVVSVQREGPVELPLDELRPGALTGDDEWAGYAAGVAWALRERGHRIPGLSITVDGDVPSGAGLSSSAALECSVAGALNDQLSLGLDRSELVAVARQAENDFVGAPTGGLDQLASIFGQRDRVLLCDMRTLDVEAVPFDLDAAGLTLLVIDTKAPHQLTDGLYGERREACAEAARLLGVPALRDLGLEELSDAMDRLPDETLRKRARHVITENDRTLACAGLLRTGQLRQIGPLLTASHASMRDDFEITVPEVDLAVEVLLAFGAFGARMTGGGFGGCVIALMEPAQARAGALAVQAAYAGRDYLEPVSFTVTAADGAHRLS
jgi:galactokinase